jgi:hypothetical protein
MSVGVDALQPTMSERHAWTIDAANFTNVLSIYGGHFGDLLFHTVGFPAQLTAVVETQFQAKSAEPSRSGTSGDAWLGISPTHAESDGAGGQLRYLVQRHRDRSLHSSASLRSTRSNRNEGCALTRVQVQI